MKKLALLLLLPTLAFAQLVDPRYCGAEVKREADGTIMRSRLVLKHYQILHPCPSTGLKTGACPGWALDHVIPLACGGCDEIGNLQWLKNTIKSCAGAECKDRWERKINCSPTQIVK
jgi:hypothetical protein